MTRTNKKYASERMKRKNPMHSAVTREKLSLTLRKIGHRPPARGGNGSGPTEPQKILADVLGYKMEHAVGIPKHARPNGCPNVYKIDVACPERMIAIEVDGGSHCSLVGQERDRRKDSCLSGLGWKVFRFTNKQVMEHLEECVRTVTSTI
jgi:hypothetical protein